MEILSIYFMIDSKLIQPIPSSSTCFEIFNLEFVWLLPSGPSPKDILEIVNYYPFGSDLSGLGVRDLVRNWGRFYQLGGLFVQHTLVPHKPWVINKADDIFTDDLPDNQRHNGHHAGVSQRDENKAIQS